MLIFDETSRQQASVERDALALVNAALSGLSCAVDPNLVVRALHVEWASWRRTRILWVSVHQDFSRPRTVRTAVGLQPEDLPALHRSEHLNSRSTLGRSWARRPLVEATLRYLIAALDNHVVLRKADPFNPRRQSVSQWARALALHYLGICPLKPTAVLKCEAQADCNDQEAGENGASLPQDIGPLLHNINYLYSGKITDPVVGIPGIEFSLFCSLAIAFACGALEGRSGASTEQIQWLKRFLPAGFQVQSVSTLPQIPLNDDVVL